jgi:hypothetical protein
MSVRFQVTCQDADGDAQVGLTVKLYAFASTVGVDPAYATMTDNSDGTYYCDVSASGKYKVTVGGVLQDELTGIWIAADDTPTAAGLSGKMALVGSPTVDHIITMTAGGDSKDSGYAIADLLSASHVNADGAGGSSVPATNMAHNAAAIGIADAGNRITATQVEAALQEIVGSGRTTETIKSLATLIGTMVLSGSSYLTTYTDITSALLGIDTKLLDLTLRQNVNASGATSKCLLVFSKTGAITSTTFLVCPGGAVSSATHGVAIPTSCSLTGVAAHWSAAAVDAGAGNFITIYPLKNNSAMGSITIADGDELNLKEMALYAAGDYPIASGDYLAVNITFGGNASITDLTVALELTFGS